MGGLKTVRIQPLYHLLFSYHIVRPITIISGLLLDTILRGTYNIGSSFLTSRHKHHRLYKGSTYASETTDGIL